MIQLLQELQAKPIVAVSESQPERPFAEQLVEANLAKKVTFDQSKDSCCWYIVKNEIAQSYENTTKRNNNEILVEELRAKKEDEKAD